MLSTEDRFVGAYMHALFEALIQKRVKTAVDAEIAVLFSWVRSIIQGGTIEKKKTPSFIELPMVK